MIRTPSKDPTPHRVLVVGPGDPMQGRDVVNLKTALVKRLEARGLDDDVLVPKSDDFTHALAVLCVEIGYWLGFSSETYLRKIGGQLACTVGAQRWIREPAERDSIQLGRAKARRERLDEGPRYWDELARSAGVPSGKGPEAALDFMGSHLGVHESPAGSNWGHPVQDWIHLTGYDSPVPWCGCVVNAALVAGGVPNSARWGIGFCPSVIVHARAGIGGWSWHSDGQMGDVILFDTPGGDTAVHQGLALKRLGPGHYTTREGNTSKGDGSQSDGGVVAERDRVSSPSFKIVGFARPPYPK